MEIKTKKHFNNLIKSLTLEVVKEELDSKDLTIIKKVIRDVVGDIYRDIWLKRNSWK